MTTQPGRIEITLRAIVATVLAPFMGGVAAIGATDPAAEYPLSSVVVALATIGLVLTAFYWWSLLGATRKGGGNPAAVKRSRVAYAWALRWGFVILLGGPAFGLAVGLLRGDWATFGICVWATVVGFLINAFVLLRSIDVKPFASALKRLAPDSRDDKRDSTHSGGE